jgi:chemotaxis protein MotB
MQTAGLRKDQVSQVRGYADQKLRVPSNPMDPSNRRISLIVQYVTVDAPPVPAGAAPPGKPGPDTRSEAASVPPAAPATGTANSAPPPPATTAGQKNDPATPSVPAKASSAKPAAGKPLAAVKSDAAKTIARLLAKIHPK